MDKHELLAAVNAQLPAFTPVLADKIIAYGLETYTGIPRDTLLRMVQGALQSFMSDMGADQPHYFDDYWKAVTPARAEAGAKVDDMFAAVFSSVDMLSSYVAEQTTDDPRLYNWWLLKANTIAQSSMIMLSQIFGAVRERIIREQEAHIRELSTPIMPLHNGVLALPLVGALDAQRAGQVMETLLNGISQQQADVVIIDITGVPVVDTNVANYLMLATRAARLLGTQIVLVGISAEVAQTITQLGADMSGITTRANMQSGVEYALALQGLTIARRG